MQPLRRLRQAALAANLPEAILRSFHLIAIAGLVALLGACHHDDDDAAAPAPVLPPMVNSFGIAMPESFAGGDEGSAAGADGTAGDGVPIVNAPVRLVDNAGHSVTARTDAQGYYAVRIDGFMPPFIVTVTRADGTVWHAPSVAAVKVRGFVTINISGLTDKLASDVAVAAGLQGAAQLTPPVLAANVPALQTAKAQLSAQLEKPIRDAGLDPATFDPVTIPFRPDKTGVDAVLESVDVTRSPDGTTVVQPEPSVGGASLTISPPNASVGPGGSVSFSANAAVTFAVSGGAANGSLVAAGSSNAVYTAPATPGAYQVVATSTADPSRRASATVNVTAVTGFRINANQRIAPGTTTQFTATLDGQAIAANWSIVGGCTGCSISASGLFTAGNTVESVTVRGSNPANAAQSASAVVTIATEVQLSFYPSTAPALTTADMLMVDTFISPAGIHRGVVWTMGPGADAGSVITVDYLYGYLPPAAPGAYTLTGTSVADPATSASLALQVAAAPTGLLLAPASLPSTMRYDHADAALPDGRILLVGGLAGRQGAGPVRGTDVFEPATRSFRAGPVLALDRVRPEAIAIDADRVLVTGGQEDWQTARDTAEILNLATGQTVAAANAMSARRILHRTVRLTTGAAAGRVLVIGGFNGPPPYGVPSWTATASADLFDPATNAFTPSTGSMNTARGLFTATPLADGRVLVVGGINAGGGNSQVLASAEIYDPVAGTFSFTGAMSTGRWGHTATRLPDGRVLVVGGEANPDRASTAEIYDPATGAFSRVSAPLTVTRRLHAAAAQADGKVLLFGGMSGDFFVVQGTVEVFDPATQSFSHYARMASPRSLMTATPITSGPAAGKVLVFGGGAQNRPELAAEITP